MLQNTSSETNISQSNKIIKRNNIENIGLIPLVLLFENKIVKFLCNISYSPSHRQAGAPVINIQLTHNTTPDFFKNFSLAVLFGSNGN